MRRGPILAGGAVAVGVLGAVAALGLDRPDRTGAAEAPAIGITSPARPHPLVVGGVEDAAKWSDPGLAMHLAARAGFGAIVLSSVWSPPLTAPDGPEIERLRAAVNAARRRHIEPVVAVYSFGRNTPVGQRRRDQFVTYAASILHAIPQIRTISIGNEPNSSLFWRPQFDSLGHDSAAQSYLRILTEAYDRLKAANPRITVIGGSLAARGMDDPRARRRSHSPTAFIRDLGTAYRSSGRRRPVMDLFSLHPYPENSSILANVPHPHSTALGIADYGRLVGLLATAFGAPPGIVYGEYGVDTRVPASASHLYRGVEPAAEHPVPEAAQAGDYELAIAIAACQPLVRMLMFFHVTDEADLRALQTGLYYPNDRPKQSLAAVAPFARAAKSGQLECSR